MAMLLFAILLALSCLRTLASWRMGIYLMIIVAAVQDPMRKMVPGTPSWMALATVPVFFTALFCPMASTPE